jgi:tetraacyldisaccharide 4'-kinase
MTFGESLLWPLSLAYGAVVRLKAAAYRSGIRRQKRLRGTVISVGNLTTGGTGKTPMVLWIAQRLIDQGKNTGILTRGYRGEASSTGPTSDEVRMMQWRLGDRAAFGVGADRFAKGSELAKRGVNWFILDDGFQHQQLARDVDIVLVDATNPFGGGHLLPAGRLREPKKALSRGDVIVITRNDHAPAVEAAIRRYSNAPIFYATNQLEYVQSLNRGSSGLVLPEARLEKWFAFCGVGNPGAFVADLRAWNFELLGWKFFRDHHRYSPQDITAIETEAHNAGASSVICTEKDIFNLSAQFDSIRSCFCHISLRIDREDDFWRAVTSAIDANGQSRG